MNAQPTMTPETAAAKKGFGNLPCLLCGNEASITLRLDDCDTLHCDECGDDFTATKLREKLAKWQRVLTWLERLPE